MIASVFLCIGIVPYSFMTNPSHSTSLQSNLHLLREIAIFSWSNLSNTPFNLSICCFVVPWDKIKMSSKKENVSFLLFRVRSMAFRNSAGMSVSP